MRRVAILATALSLIALACEPPKPASKAETEAKTEAPAEVPDPVASFDATKSCDRQATLLEAQMAQIPDAAEPPPDWRVAYVADCTAAMKDWFESDPSGTLAYAQCLDEAESPHTFVECQAARELSRRQAQLARQARAPLPSGADVCAVQAPTVRGGRPAPAGSHVAISSKAICVDESPVVAMIDGAIDPAAVENHRILAVGVPVQAGILARRQDPQHAAIHTPQGIYEPVKLSIDKTTSFAVVVDVLYTVTREGASEVWYAAGGEGFLPASPPIPMGLDADTSVGNVFITESGLTVLPSSGEGSTIALADASLPLTDPGRWDLAAFETTLAALEASSTATSVTISAENTIPFEIVAKVIDVARGPTCPVTGEPSSWTRENCRFPRIVLEAGAG